MDYFKVIVLSIALAAISTESKAQWEEVSSAPSGTINDIEVSDGVIYLGLYSYGIYNSTDSGATWNQLNNGLNSFQAKSVYQMLFYEGNIYAATVDGIYKSTDQGQSWIKKSNGITIGPGATYEFTESIFEYNEILFTGAWNGIYASLDNGETWGISNVSGQGIGPRFFVNHFGTLFAARENINFPNGYVSTDDGFTWEPLTTISLPTITFLSEPGKLWAGTIGGVWLSTDNGASWIDKSEGLNLDPYSSSIIRVNGDLITSLKFGGSDMYYSNNEGEYWMDFGDGLPFVNSIEKLMVYGDKILAATSEGLWQRDIADIPTGIEDDENRLPKAFEVSQNYPNPFNARTTIDFALSRLSDISIAVYDLQGRKLETIFEGAMDTGDHSVTWNAAEYSSGVYFYNIRSGEFNVSRKMVLLK